MKLTYLVFIVLTCIINPLYAAEPQTQKLLEQWEKLQQASNELKTFKKVSEGIYHITFNTIPFEGNIELVNVDLEEAIYENTLPISYIGIIELKYPKKLQDLKESYYRSFSRWEQSVYWYYNSDTSTWITNKAYDKLSNSYYQTKEQTKLSRLLTQYSAEVLILLTTLFIVISVLQLWLLWRIANKHHSANN